MARWHFISVAASPRGNVSLVPRGSTSGYSLSAALRHLPSRSLLAAVRSDLLLWRPRSLQQFLTAYLPNQEIEQAYIVTFRQSNITLFQTL